MRFVNGRNDSNAELKVRSGGVKGSEVEKLAAVSYTHLRAHETVLDIVCRLLLEKKKKMNSSLCYEIMHQYSYII